MADILDKIDPKGSKVKWLGLGVGFVTLLVGYLAFRHASSASATTQAATGSPASTDTSSTGPGAGVDSSQLDSMFQQQQVQYQQLATLLQGLYPTTSPSVGPGSSNPGGIGPIEPVVAPGGNPAQRQLGSGYLPSGNWGTPIKDTESGSSLFGDMFHWIANPAQAPKGSTFYYEPTPGRFVPVTKTTKITPNTPQYIH